MISITEKRSAEITAAFSFLKNVFVIKYIGKIANELKSGGKSEKKGMRGRSVNS